MAFAVVQPGTVSGRITPPPSKSAAHRALICAALAGGSTVDGVLPSADMQAHRAPYRRSARRQKSPAHKCDLVPGARIPTWTGDGRLRRERFDAAFFYSAVCRAGH